MKRILLTILITLTCLTACAPQNSAQDRVDYLGVGEVVFGELALTGYLYDWGSDRSDLHAVKNAIVDELADIDAQVNINVATSDLARFNANVGGIAMDGGTGYEIGLHAFETVGAALTVNANTEGAFDATLAPLSRLWQVDAAQIHGTHDDFTVPTEQEIAGALTATGMDGISLAYIDEKYYLVKSDPALTVDLGGVAKGYACDRIEKILEQYGVAAAALSLSGNVLIRGKMPSVVRRNGAYYYTGETAFTCGITDPFDTAQASLISFESKGGAVVTSGDYERNFMHGGVRICHIIDPQTGIPVNAKVNQDGVLEGVTQGALTSVTVFHASGAIADAYATAILVMGMEQGLGFCRTNGIQALLIGLDGRYAYTGNNKAIIRSQSTWNTRGLAPVQGYEVRS